MKYDRIDGVNYVERQIPTASGPVVVPGLTVRALKKALENADPDDMVTYIFEQGETVMFGVIGGAVFGGLKGVCALVGPEAARGAKAAGWTAKQDEDHAPEPLPVDRSATTTTDGKPIDQRPESDDANGQHRNYVVLTDEERSKGFVRPVRDAYKHLECGSITTMGRAIAETYARDPKFYGATYCSKCRGHFPVGEDGEFVWYENDGSIGPKVGT